MPKKDRTRCEVLKSPPRKRAKQDQSNSQIALSSPSQSRDDSILKHADEYTSCFCFVNKRKLGNHKLYYQRSPSWLSWPLFSQLSKFSSRDHVMKKLYNSVMKVAERPYEYGMHGAIFNLEFSPDNQYLLAACEKNDILVYDPWNFNKVHVIPNAHREGVNCINFLDTRMFATCSDDKRIAIWDIRNLNSKVFDLIGHTSWVKSMCKSSGNLISSAFDDTVRFWDLKKNSLDSIKGEIILEMPNLTRTKLSNKEGEKSSRLYVATTTGLLLAVHNLDITTLKNDTDKELKHIDKTCVPDLPAEPLRKSYTPTKSNQVELIQSFPAGSKPWCIASIQLHPTEDMVLSRYTNQRVNSEWSVVHSLNTDPSAGNKCLYIVCSEVCKITGLK